MDARLLLIEKQCGCLFIIFPISEEKTDFDNIFKIYVQNGGIPQI